MRCFRGRKTAAPLKRLAYSLDGRIPNKFPRSKDRGSVEARHWLALCCYGIRFPRSKDRGSVEATTDIEYAAPFSFVSAVERPRLR